jgi:hypothetical protein
MFSHIWKYIPAHKGENRVLLVYSSVDNAKKSDRFAVSWKETVETLQQFQIINALEMNSITTFDPKKIETEGQDFKSARDLNHVLSQRS